MKRKASIICLTENKKKIINSFMNNNEYIIESIFENDINFSLLKDIDSIFIDGNLSSEKIRKLEIYSLDNNIEFHLFPTSTYLRKGTIKDVDGLFYFRLNNYRLTKLNLFLKRAFDLAFAIIFIVISFPLFILIYLLIKIFDRGPVLYMQKRLTIDENEYVIYKFRTMKVNAEKDTGVVLSTEDDPRLTRIGKILRKYRLDELPQIFNVLNGSMSVVGPRPERKYFVEKYKKQNEFYKYRFNVKAGITGYAQIYGKYDSSFEEKLDYDLYYIANYSFINDLKIIIKTLVYSLSRNKTKIYKVSKLKNLKNELRDDYENTSYKL